MQYLDLFIWWAMTISAGIAFLILVSIYLYTNSRTKRSESRRTTRSGVQLGRDFVFVWVLIGLLVFYIVSIQIGSSVIFAAGNIMVEAILVVYLIKNRQKKPEQTPRSRSW